MKRTRPCKSCLSRATTRTHWQTKTRRPAMGDYEVGYGKPPKKFRFKPGTSGNPKGRPVRDRTLLGEIVKTVLDAPVQYREKGRARTGTRREVSLKLLVQQALKGDVGAADMVQRRYAAALRQAGTG